MLLKSIKLKTKNVLNTYEQQTFNFIRYDQCPLKTYSVGVFFFFETYTLTDSKMVGSLYFKAKYVCSLGYFVTLL